MERFDAVVIGAGAAGLHCAAIAGQRGLKVLLLDHADKVAEKIRISGGGRCNFTNRDAGPAQFVSDNPPFCRSALARYTPRDFVALVARHRIGWHEKHRGQLFCDDTSERIIAMLLAEAAAGGVVHRQPCAVHRVRQRSGGGFEVDTGAGSVAAASLVVATGGLSIPKIGATDFGHRLARQFGHRIVPTRPGLVPLVFAPDDWSPFAALAGVSLEVGIATPAPPERPRARFTEDLLFTHRGLSGPAVLQVSTYWQPGEPITIDLGNGTDLGEHLVAAKSRAPERQIGGVLGGALPARLATGWLDHAGADPRRVMQHWPDRELRRIGASLRQWSIRPSGSEGYRKAEVTAGGVDTRDLDSRHLGSRLAAGLHFIGEVVDVTGWLGGYNFQWAWASAHACAQSLPRLAAGGAKD